MTEQRRTRTASEAQRGGTYYNESAVSALLRYRAHDIYDLRSRVTAIGADKRDVDIWLLAAHVSARHCRIERRSRGAVLMDDGSKNGTYHESRTFGLGLKPSFEALRVGPGGVVLTPGTTFVVGGIDHRYIAIDRAIREAHPALTDILGIEDEVRDQAELVSPSDLILAADSGGHMLITGEPGCEQEALARIVHHISKRRHNPLVERQCVPDDWEARGALLKREAVHGTLVLQLTDAARPIDRGFLSCLFSPEYKIRVIALARTLDVARKALGPAYARPMMHVGLRPLKQRPPAIPRLLDRCLAGLRSPLRVADLTEENQRALRVFPWPENLAQLRETARRLDALIRAPDFCRNLAWPALGVARTTFYRWFDETLRLSEPLVPHERAQALKALLAA